MKRTIQSKYLLAASAALATFLVYCSTFHHAFVDWDDPFYVVDNPHIRTLNSELFRWAFFDFYASNWHPLTWISHAIDYAFWGLDPSGHHLTNIMLHSINTFLVVLLVIKIMELIQKIPGDNHRFALSSTRSIWIAAGVTGLLFGLHPLHVESVAWVSERKDLLCALFFLLSIMMYANYVQSVRTEIVQNSLFLRFTHRNYALAVFFFILALLSKPMAVTLPLVLLILDWYPFNRISTRSKLFSACVEKLPFIIFAVISSILTVLAQRSGGALQSLDYIPLSSRFLVSARSVILYLWKMLWPLNLVPHYSYPQHPSLWSPEYFLSIALLVAITTGCAIMAKKQPIGLFAWIYFLITLIPVIGIVQVGSQPMADRYTYLPALGPFVLIGLAAAVAWDKAFTASRLRRGMMFIAATLTVFVLSALISLTLKQIDVWKNGMVLWNYIIDKKTDAPTIYYNRGIAFSKMGMFDRALEDNNMAIALNPTYVEAYSNRGQVFDSLGKIDLAIADYDRALALDPNYFQACYNRGLAYIKTRQFDKAATDFTKAISMNPSFLNSYHNRATAFFLSGQFAKALADLNTVLTLDPSNYQALDNRARVFQKLGQRDNAEKDFAAVKALRPFQ